LAPGDTVRLHVSTTAARWRAELVRLWALEIPVSGVPGREELVDSVEPIERDGLDQRSPVGSYGFRNAHRELGLSLYETHADGSGVAYSSWRRPILTMRPTVYNHDGPVWQFAGDMQLVDWLDRTGRDVDVVCDRDVHDEGARLLGRYACVLTGTHPEYPSEQMLDAYADYVAGGGRLMYMGGNGMYWVTGYDPEDEVDRRRTAATVTSGP
jgi:hypothetical protein